MSRALIVIHSKADRERAARWAAQVPPGSRIEFKAPRRSLDQNAKMWCLLQEIAAQVDWYGSKLSSEDWKDVFTASLRKARVVPGIDPGTAVALGLRTSDMSKAEMADLIELMLMFGANHGVRWSDPNEPPQEEEGQAA